MGFEASEQAHQEIDKNQGGSELSAISLTSLVPAGSPNAELLANNENRLTKSVSNLAGVYSNLFPELPSALAAQLKTDLQNPGSTALKLAESAAIGFGTAVLLAKSPVLAKTLLAGAGISASALMLGGTMRFSAEAMSANTPDEQARLGISGAQTVGRLTAELLETAPAMAAGAVGGFKLVDKVPTLASLSAKVRDLGELPARRLVPEGFHYLSTDAGTAFMSRRAAGAPAVAAEFDILQAAKEMTQRTPWKGIEEGRFFKTAGNDAIKMSARLPGNPDEVMMGRRAQQMFHTHEKALLPTSSDFNSVYGTGVIGVPERGIITFYEGTGREAQRLSALMKTNKTPETALAVREMLDRDFRSLVVDPAKELAVRVDMRWSPAENRMRLNSIQPLDYSATVNKLSKWNGKLNIESMQTASEALLKPGMTDLLRKIGS